MKLSFKLNWSSRKKRLDNMHIEVAKLRDIFGAEGGNFMSLKNGDVEFQSPNQIDKKLIQAKLKEHYPEKQIRQNGGQFIINLEN